MLKGKLTYTSLIIIALASVGLKVTGDEVNAVYSLWLHAVEVAGMIGAVYGRWRATRG